jgi:predicted NBD/HSP70 family sugar kinase
VVVRAFVEALGRTGIVIGRMKVAGMVGDGAEREEKRVAEIHIAREVVEDMKEMVEVVVVAAASAAAVAAPVVVAAAAVFVVEGVVKMWQHSAIFVQQVRLLRFEHLDSR